MKKQILVALLGGVHAVYDGGAGKTWRKKDELVYQLRNPEPESPFALGRCTPSPCCTIPW